MWDFPAAPTNGQVFSPVPGANYTFNGVAWVYSIGATPLTITALAPAFMVAGGSDVTMRIQGVGFASASVIHLDGVPIATVFASNEELQCTMLASVETGARLVTVTVRNDTIESNALTFNYVAVPVLTSCTPPSISCSGTLLDVSCVGTGFIPESLVFLNFNVVPTVFVSTTELTATISPNSGTPGDSMYIQVQHGAIITSNQLLFGFTA